MHCRLLKFLDLNISLFGFRPGRSCEHALFNEQNSLPEHRIVFLLLPRPSEWQSMIFCLEKEHYGTRGLSLKWIESNLERRTRFVAVNGSTSTPSEIWSTSRKPTRPFAIHSLYII